MIVGSASGQNEDQADQAEDAGVDGDAAVEAARDAEGEQHAADDDGEDAAA